MLLRGLRLGGRRGPAQDRLTRGARLVEAAARRVTRRLGEARLVAAAGGEREVTQRGDEQVERGLALRLGRGTPVSRCDTQEITHDYLVTLGKCGRQEQFQCVMAAF